jgi:hypothetical protein
LKAWALEINASPSLNIYFEKEEFNLNGIFKSTAHTENYICPVDLHVKSRLVNDALHLAC